MKRETHSDMFLFATSFSWWMENLQVAVQPASAGLPRHRGAPLKPAQGTKLLIGDDFGLTRRLSEAAFFGDPGAGRLSFVLLDWSVMAGPTRSSALAPPLRQMIS